MKKLLFTSVAILSLAVQAVTVQAEEAAPDPAAQAVAATKAKAELLSAQAEEMKARKDLLDAQAGALNLPKFDGKTTLKDNAGTMEAWLLSSGTIESAAAKIGDTVQDACPATSCAVVILAGSETVNFALPASLTEEMDTLTTALGTAVTYGQSASAQRDSCTIAKPKPPTKNRYYQAMVDPNVGGANVAEIAANPGLAVAGAVIGALKSDTEINGLSLAPADRLLVNALAGTRRDKIAWIVWAEATLPTNYQQTEVYQSWRKLATAHAAASACRRMLDADAPRKEGKPELIAATRLTELEAVLARADEFITRTTQSAEGKPSLLLQAVQLSALNGLTPLVLRVNIEQAGGSLFKRDNLWTAVGLYSGVRVTGGLVVSYRVSDPATGVARSGGVVSCRTEYASLKDVQRADSYRANCAATRGKKT